MDLRTQSCEDAIEHVERALGVRLDREAAVVKRRSVEARTDRGNGCASEPNGSRFWARAGGMGSEGHRSEEQR